MLNTITAIYGDGTGEVGDYQSISTVTVGGGGAASVSFSSIPSTYTHLQVRGILRSTGAGSADFFATSTFNSDSGSNYSVHYLFGDGASVTASGLSSQTKNYAGVGIQTSGLANTFGVLVLDILDYANTNKYKTIRSLSGDDRNGAGSITLISGAWLSTSAITSMVLIPPTGNFAQYSHFALYGIKG